MSPVPRYERRFTGRIIRLSLPETIARWFHGYGWHRERFVFDEVLPGDPRYDDAPYAETFLFPQRVSHPRNGNDKPGVPEAEIVV